MSELLSTEFEHFEDFKHKRNERGFPMREYRDLK